MADFQRAFHRLCRALIKNQRHPVTVGDLDQSGRGFGVLKLLRRANGLIQFVNRRADALPRRRLADLLRHVQRPGRQPDPDELGRRPARAGGGHGRGRRRPFVVHRIDRDTDRDYIMSADQGKEYGIIDDVIRKRA